MATCSAAPPTRSRLPDVIRAVDGPLANVRDLSLTELSYPGAAESLREVWMAVRGSLREVLENVTVADLASGRLPKHVKSLAARHQAERVIAPHIAGRRRLFAVVVVVCA